jgi:hypothetical protein
MEYVNQTDLVAAPAFILKQLEPFDTSKLRLHLKFHRRKDQAVSGYFRYKDLLVMAAVRENQRLPLKNEWPVGSRKSRGPRGWAWVWDGEPVHTRDELMAWIAGHELFHFLRHTRQVEGIQRETRANRFGFKWLREFKAEEARRAA